MQKIILIGNSARDVELEIKGETKFARISLAVTRRFDKETTDWFNCTVFGALAEKVASVYVKKGTKVAITGRIEFNDYEKEDGTKIKNHTVIVEDLELLGGKTENENREELTEIKDDNLPF